MKKLILIAGFVALPLFILKATAQKMDNKKLIFISQKLMK